MRLLPIYSLADADGEVHAEALRQGAAVFHPSQVLSGDGPWEVEIGYGKGRYLLEQARARPDERFLGIEVVSKYFKMLRRRARHWGAENLLNVRGEALYLLGALLPRGFARRLHVYFPDPWPKAKHHRRRLFDHETVDLVLGALAPGGELCFATDFLDYGELVMELLESHPDLEVEPLHDPWPDGARTNYEAKYMEEGRPILRCRARVADDAEPGAFHPRGRGGIVAAWAVRNDSGDD